MIDDHTVDLLLNRAASQPLAHDALMDRIEMRIRARRQLRQGAAGALVLLMVAAGVFIQIPATSAPLAPRPAGVDIPLANIRPAQVELDSGYLTERVDSSNPNVTIVRVLHRYVDPSAEPTPVAPDATDTSSSET